MKQETMENKNFKDMKIEFAPDNEIIIREQMIDKLLEAIGYPEAFVTDESMLWDFHMDDEEEKGTIKNGIKESFGIDLPNKLIEDGKIWHIIDYIQSHA